mmetsp:Transcript_100332/g.323792  ORF Transcript_100332/g.323792 Transcript_100332/m.323792 type:complete len:211 (-) Transcript_100332:658-1290(-)
MPKFPDFIVGCTLNVDEDCLVPRFGEALVNGPSRAGRVGGPCPPDRGDDGTLASSFYHARRHQSDRALDFKPSGQRPMLREERGEIATHGVPHDHDLIEIDPVPVRAQFGPFYHFDHLDASVAPIGPTGLVPDDDKAVGHNGVQKLRPQLRVQVGPTLAIAVAEKDQWPAPCVGVGEVDVYLVRPSAVPAPGRHSHVEVHPDFEVAAGLC